MRPSPRVLFVSPTNDPYGACRSMLDLLRGLPQRGYAPVVALKTPGPLGEILDREGIPWFPIEARRWIGRRRSALGRGRSRIDDLLTARRVAAIVQKQGVALVHTNTLSSPVGALVAARASLPHLWHLRETVDTEAGSSFVYGLGPSVRLIDRSTSLVPCISRYVMERSESYVSPAKLRLLYNGPLDPANARVPLAERPSLSANRPIKLLLVGKISPRKGHPEAIRALALLRERGLDARLVFAGDGREKEAAPLRALVRTLGLDGAVEWMGYVDPRPLYGTCDVSLLCGPREPSGRVTIESQAAGIPTVGVRSGGIPEIVEAGVTGWLYEEGDPESLARCVQEAIATSTDGLRTIREEGRRRAYARFNVDRYRDEAVALYREVGV